MPLEPARRQHLLFGGLGQCRQWSRALEWRAPREDLVEDRSQRVDFGGRRDVGGRAGRLLGRHVIGSAHDVAGARQARLALHQLGQPEVGDLGDTILRENDVRRLEVAMDDAALVGIMQRAGERLNEPRCLARRLRIAAELLLEAAAARVFQDQIALPL
jgi:hypothetical protein